MAEDAAAERSLGRVVAFGLPLATVAGALAAGLLASLGSALLVLASGTLLGTIGLLWASVRTLAGDAPLSVELETNATRARGTDELEEKKLRLMRALKDLQGEHALGRIEESAYADLTARYREEAKAVMREMDALASPARARAERAASEYLERRGLKGVATRDGVDAAAPPRRVSCAACGASNEADAKFCKECGATVLEAANAS